MKFMFMNYWDTDCFTLIDITHRKDMCAYHNELSLCVCNFELIISWNKIKGGAK